MRADKNAGIIKLKVLNKFDVTHLYYEIILSPIDTRTELSILIELEVGILIDARKKADKYFNVFLDKVDEILTNPIEAINISALAPLKTPRMLSTNDFISTIKIGKFLYINEHDRTLFIPPHGFMDKYGTPLETRVVNFGNLLSYELIEDGETITSGGLGAAALGALTFGIGGAIVGSVVGSKKSRGTCSQLEIKLTLNKLEDPVKYIVFNKTAIPRSGIIYKELKLQANECLALLENIMQGNRNKQSQSNENEKTKPLTSEADELLKFHELLGKGIISQEEFERMKKKILGL